MIETVQLSQATCDGCGRARLGDSDEENIPGIMGAVVRIAEDGTGTEAGHAEWYACRVRCIGPAATNALRRHEAANQNNHVQPELT